MDKIMSTEIDLQEKSNEIRSYEKKLELLRGAL